MTTTCDVTTSWHLGLVCWPTSCTYWPRT